jgi:uncharacterized repeat protein (TIGR01451 family)
MKTHRMIYLTLALIAVARIVNALGMADLGLSVNIPNTYCSFQFNAVYTIIVTNAGPAAATGVVVSNQIPANTTFVSATTGGSPVNGVLLVNVGTLASGATNSFQVVLQPNLEFPILSSGQPIASLTNRFQVSANETDPVTNNNSAITVVSIYDAYPGTPLAWVNPGGTTVITSSILFSGAPRPLHVGEPSGATNAQPGDIVVLIDPNGGTNINNWAAVARFFNPGDPTGTNNMGATNSQAFFASDFGASGFTNFHLLPEVSFVSEATAFTNNDGVITITAEYVEFGPTDGIYGGQEDFNIMQINVALGIAHANNQAVVSWSPAVAGWTLQTNNNLSHGTWTDYEGSYGNNAVTNSSANGNLFFRLIHL